MQTIEGIVSFLVFISIAGMILMSVEEKGVDDSLYRYQLGNDVWRVLWLRGGLTHFDKGILQSDVEKISENTGLEIYFEEEDVGTLIEGKEIIVIKKIAVVRGEPKEITMVISKL